MLILPLESVANVSEANAASIFKVKVSCMITHFDHEDRGSVYLWDSGNSVHIRTVQRSGSKSNIYKEKYLEPLD
jgi:hypothetical protein